MDFTLIDTLVFFAFVALVVGISLMKSRGEKGSEDYFLAGRGLSWPLIGFSLIAANISTEQFVGMSGNAASDMGIAIASWEWIAAITLVFVAFVSLPKFLKSGIYTMPQFLEDRFDSRARTVMSLFMIFAYVAVTITAVIYSGALMAVTLFDGLSVFGHTLGLAEFSCLIAAVAALYVFFGGLKACAWADLIQGIALILGGAFITYFAFVALGGTPVAEIAHTKDALATALTDDSGAVTKFLEVNSNKLSMFLDKEHSGLPWTALLLAIWIPNFYYWGFNQYITQRTLGASSLQEGQKGVLFAGYMKIVVPFVIILPGMMAFNLFADEQAAEASNDKDIMAGNVKSLMLLDLEAGKALEAKSISIKGKDVEIITSSDFSGIQSRFDSIKNAGKEFVYSVDKGFDKYHPDYATQIVAHNNKIAEMGLTKDKIAKVSLVTYKFDSAFAILIKRLIPDGFKGFILAALLGAVVSSLASMLNAASTIFSIDIYKKLINKNASDSKQVMTGKVCVVIFAIFGALIAPFLADPRFDGIFTFIQEFQGYFSPGVLAVFIIGFFAKKAPRFSGFVGLALTPVIYGYLHYFHGDIAFLNRMSITFVAILALMLAMTALKPMAKEVVFNVDERFNTETSKATKIVGYTLIALVVLLYVVFSGLFFS